MMKKGFVLLSLALCLTACEGFNRPLKPWIDEQYELMQKVLDVSVSPQNVAVPTGASRQFTAQVNVRMDADRRVTWRVSGATDSATLIDGDGLLSVGTGESLGTALIVTATSVFDPGKSASALVIVGTGGSSVRVIFNPSGGTWSDSTTATKEITVNAGDNVSAPSFTLDKTGLTFAGWYTAAGGSGTEVPLPTPLAADTTLYARWNATVTFDANGGNWGGSPTQTATVIEGGTVSAPAAPSKSGLTLAGWSLTPTGTEVTLSTHTITQNTTLYARWTAIITFDDNGGSGGPGSVPLEEGTTLTSVPGSLPAKTGLDFAGWYTADVGGTLAAFPHDAVNTTLYAHWTATVTFDSNGGNWSGASSPTPLTVTENDLVTAPSEGLNNAGYTFAGWSLTSDGAAVSFPYPVTANITLYARWTPYPIVTDAAGLSAAVSTGGTINITADFSVNSPFTIPSGVNLTITGSGTITWTGTGSPFFQLGSGASLILNGVTLQGNSLSNGAVVHVNNGGAFIMNSGTISGNTTYHGGGVYVSGGGSFTMVGGNITGNTVTGGGGGVYVVSGGTFTLDSPATTSNVHDNMPSQVYKESGGTITINGIAGDGW
ncbi:MAG: hypothetical protein Pg6C_10840 [Treponemataceae bacterium]|nr:MAG: hypothetical protein Pg6C_10840 [Treponemataceae bacterium]